MRADSPSRFETPRARRGADRVPNTEELRRMDRDGYLLVRQFFAPSEIAAFLSWTADLSAAPEAPGRHWVYHEESATVPGERLIQRIENFCPFHQEFDRVIRRGILNEWIGVLMGGPVVLFKEKINFKMPGGAGFKAHQDQQAGWGRYAPLFVTAMVTLDAATVENGCLKIAPSRHREGLIGEEWQPLAETGIEFDTIPTEAGDVIFFDSFVPHASQENTTAAPRRILYLTYNLARDGDQRQRYYTDKHAAFPPDIERESGTAYVFRV